MRTPESRLERIEEIERKLAQYPRGLTTGELAREFHVDPSSPGALRRVYQIEMGPRRNRSYAVPK